MFCKKQQKILYLKWQYFYVWIAQQQLWMTLEHLFLNMHSNVDTSVPWAIWMPLTDTNELCSQQAQLVNSSKAAAVT